MICPYCHAGLDPELEWVLSCSNCRTPIHVECAGLHGCCVSLGCPSEDFTRARAQFGRTRLEPSWPTSVYLREALRQTVLVALAPREGVAVVLLAAVGLLGLALLA